MARELHSVPVVDFHLIAQGQHKMYDFPAHSLFLVGIFCVCTGIDSTLNTPDEIADSDALTPSHEASIASYRFCTSGCFTRRSRNQDVPVAVSVGGYGATVGIDV